MFATSMVKPTPTGSASAAFNWDDPFLLEDQLTEDERMIRDSARAYAQEKLRHCHSNADARRVRALG